MHPIVPDLVISIALASHAKIQPNARGIGGGRQLQPKLANKKEAAIADEPGRSSDFA